MTFAGLILGLVLLISGGGLVVRGASDLATKYGVSPMIVGLTIVGFGTSAPELVVNVLGAVRGETELAFGNVVGSNISNLGLILGIAALLAPITLQGKVVRREVPLLLLATTMMTVMALDMPLEGTPAIIGRTDSIVLILMFCLFIYITAIDFLRERHAEPLMAGVQESEISTQSASLPVVLLIVGGALLFSGGEMTVRFGSALAVQLGVSQAIIGLFVVAVGTSMPELVTTIIAAMRRESDLAVGNIVGSNIFNGLFVLPISGLIVPITVPQWGVGDLMVSWLFAALLIPIFFIGSTRFGRPAGVFFLVSYFVYAVFRIGGFN